MARIPYNKLRPFVHTLIWGLFTLKMANVFLGANGPWRWFFAIFYVLVIFNTNLNFYYLIPRYFLKDRYTAYIKRFLFQWAANIVLLMSLVPFFERYPLPFHHAPGDYFITAPFNFSLEFGGLVVLKLLKELYIKYRKGAIHKKNADLYKMEKMQAELQLMRGQLNPHFLFNTLNNIYSLIIKKSENAGDSILMLSAMLDHILYKANEEKVSLRKEIEFINSYVALEGLRFDASQPIVYETDINEDGVIAPLILFNFIENAFKHAGEVTKYNNEPTFIRINIFTNNGSLHMKVINGYSQQSSSTIEKGSGGIGIENARKRLNMIYNANYSLRIDEDINDENSDTMLYSIDLKIPIQ